MDKVAYIKLGSLVAAAFGVGYIIASRKKASEEKATVISSLRNASMCVDGKGLLIITGASKGIGLAIVRDFKDAGWEVLNISRSRCDVEGVKNFRSDFSESGWDTAAADFFKELFADGLPRRITLVHNAAVMAKDSSLECDIDVLRNTLEVNVIAPAALNKIVSPFLGDHSSIIYIGSTLSEKGVPGTASYVTSKHAVAGMMKATCQDLKGRQVHTACVCPGFTATEMLVAHLGASPAVRDYILGIQTMGRLIDPAEIARFVYFVANNPTLNGAVLHCNLGQVER